MSSWHMGPQVVQCYCAASVPEGAGGSGDAQRLLMEVAARRGALQIASNDSGLAS